MMDVRLNSFVWVGDRVALVVEKTLAQIAALSNCERFTVRYIDGRQDRDCPAYMMRPASAMEVKEALEQATRHD